MPLINFSGLASGIDSEALIEATSEAARAARVTPLEEQVTELTETNTALDELTTLLNEVKTAASTFSSLNGGGVAKSAVSSDETSVSAIASNSASTGTYELTVNQLASNAIYSFNERTTNPNADIITVPGESGAIEITYGTGSYEKTISVDVDENMSWNELAAAINTEALTSGMSISSSIVNVGTESSPSYALFINGKEQGTEKGTISVDTTVSNSTPNPPNDDLLVNYLDSTAGTISQALDAEFTMTGIAGTITRSSNTINDLIPGVTLNLEGVSGGAVTVNVGVDAATTESRVQEFIDKYNELVEFINENNLVTREEDGSEVTNIFAPLASTRVDDNALTSIRSVMSGTVYDIDGEGAADTDPLNENSVRIFADLGIITDRDAIDGSLKFVTADATIGSDFQTAIEEEPDSVAALLSRFADTVTATAGTIDQFTGFNRLIDVTERGNSELISDINDRIARAEESIARNEQTLRARFARLESVVSGLQNQQQALTSALAGLG